MARFVLLCFVAYALGNSGKCKQLIAAVRHRGGKASVATYDSKHKKSTYGLKAIRALRKFGDEWFKNCNHNGRNIPCVLDK